MAGRGIRYPEEFKREAVQLILQGRSYPAVAEALGCSTYALRDWVKKHKVEQGELADEPTAAERAEIRDLKRELFETRQERDLLKKACAVFAKDARTLPE